MSKHSIIISNISKSYGNIKAVDDISLNVKKGELFGLIGSDGAGKTTLLRILTTLLLSDSGNAQIENFDVKNNYKNIRQIVGYMPGRFSLYEDLSVEENLNFFASIFNTTVAQNYDLIKDVYSYIEPFKKRRAGQLSGGMKQKLALSCALIHKPKVLFLDEPTTGVDAVSRKEFWGMLKNLQKKDITIMVSTPYMDEAGLCDRISLMQNGKFMETDTPENIINKFQKQIYSIKSKNKQKLIKDLRKYKQTYSANIFGQAIHYIDKRNNIKIDELKNHLKSENHIDIEIKAVKPNIEDCFIELMKKEQSAVTNQLKN
ncbi:MAG: ABC transporter ATP-binding protein [Chlorobi bacterium]|nr:ABC transporter ATP-binding protein [Chlorobiota bacterium]